MTAQTPDIIILNSEAFNLHTTPLESYFERIKWRPRFLRRDSGNWRGYVARWEVFGERPFLTGLFGMSWAVPRRLRGKMAPDPDPFEPEWDGVKSMRLPDLFPDQAPLVFAGWVTERLVVPTGPPLAYVHACFASFHATYRTIEVVGGRVHSIRNWDGREWAQETGYDWPIESIISLERLAEGDEEGDDDFGDWRTESDPNLRWFGYACAQTDALHKPCGQIPTE